MPLADLAHMTNSPAVAADAVEPLPRLPIERPISIAPMMDRTDRHYRYFMRQITRHTLLYTEMVTAQAITYGDRDHLLGFTPDECPLILQVGGDDPKKPGRLCPYCGGLWLRRHQPECRLPQRPGAERQPSGPV